MRLNLSTSIVLVPVLSVLAAMALQPTLADLKLDNRHIENFILSQLNMNSGGDSENSSPGIPKPAVELYKAMSEQAKVAAVQQVLAATKSIVMSGSLLASQDKSIANQYGAKDYGLKMPNKAEIAKMPAAAQSKAMLRLKTARIVHDVYRQEFVDSLRKGVEMDLRGAKFQAQRMPNEKPDPQAKVTLLEAALAVPQNNEAEFRRKVAEAKVFAAGIPTDGLDIEQLAKEGSQAIYNQYSPKGKIKAGLAQFIALAAKVNFTATTVAKGERQVFTNPAIERAPKGAKFLYRLGKGPTDAAVVFAKAWLAELP
ncbi:MAG: hypothetical protein ACK58M_01865 [Acidobacteriota bacterium]|jgi:hypothetical protein|nr:hypothetical protein [Bryobacteraceae bacterium CoA2 C42]